MPGTVIVRQGRWVLPQDPVPLVVSEIVEATCGCQVFIGRRIDNHEVASSASACTDEHLVYRDAFNVALHDSLRNPQGRDLSAVCADLLREALP